MYGKVERQHTIGIAGGSLAIDRWLTQFGAAVGGLMSARELLVVYDKTRHDQNALHILARGNVRRSARKEKSNKTGHPKREAKKNIPQENRRCVPVLGRATKRSITQNNAGASASSARPKKDKQKRTFRPAATCKTKQVVDPYEA